MWSESGVGDRERYVGLSKHTVMRFGSDTQSVGRVREAVRGLLDGCDERFVETAALLTDELVTNAVVHGHEPCAITFDLVDDRLRVSVADASTAMPRVLGQSLTREHGRGISIVDALSTCWGAHSTGRVKEVWFELLAADAAAPGHHDRAGPGAQASGPAR